MKYAYFDAATPSPHVILGWYHVQDANDPEGEIYHNLPTSAFLVAVPASIWADTMGRANGAYRVDTSGATPTVIPTPGPTAAQQLAQAQQAQIQSLAASYRAAIAAKIAFTTAAGVAQTFQADPQSVSNMQAMLAAYTPAGALPSGFYWVAADNTQVAFTLADLQGLAKAAGGQGWTAFQHLQTLKGQVLAATTVAAVTAIVW